MGAITIKDNHTYNGALHDINNCAEFYAKLKGVLLDMGQDEIVKDMAV